MGRSKSLMLTAGIVGAAAFIAVMNCSGVLVPNPPPARVDAREEAPVPKEKGGGEQMPPGRKDLVSDVSDTGGVDFAGAFGEDFLTHDTAAVTEAVKTTSAKEPSLRYPDIKHPKRPVRVQVRRGVKTAALSSAAPVQVRTERGGTTFRGQMRVEFVAGGKAVAASVGNEKKELRLPCTLFVQNGANPLTLDDNQYRGLLIITPEDGGAVMFINVLDIEEYLRGVVPLEIGYLKKEEIEAVKAQAVAARTYTYKKMAGRADNPFDLMNTVADQVYGGAKAESEVSDLAVVLTKDLVMAYEGELVNAYYHSTCGGATANIEDVWGANQQQYLRSIRDVNTDGKAYCAPSNSFAWTESWSVDQLAKNIKRYSSEGNLNPPFKGGSLRRVEASEHFQCGRVKTLSVTSSSGEKHTTGGDKTRFLLRRNANGNPILRSSLITDIKKSGSEVTITGSGNGHGVGMCQVGAINRARTGQSFETILSAYYTGITIRTLVE